MSAPRLNFLYPHLFNSAKAYESTALRQTQHARRKAMRKVGLTTSSRHLQETYAQRYGPANDPGSPPPLLPPSSKSAEDPKSLATAIEKEVKTPPSKRDAKKPDTPSETSKASSTSTKPSQETKPAPENATRKTPESTSPSPNIDAAESHPAEDIRTSSTQPTKQPLERVLHIESTEEHEEHKPPHLQAPPYVHHFDTFTLVRNLENGGYTEAQSVTLMKAVRGLLAQNLDIARDGLVSKSDVQNETYLFRAACSELRTEILSLRRTSSMTKATQRSHLQHSFDILSQRASQEALALKDDLRGLLNDRKMDVNMQQQGRESAIQELNYKITVALNSGAKSEVEGLRWFLVRRAVVALVIGVLGVVGGLRWSASLKRKAEEEDERRRKAGEGERGGGSGGGGGGEGERYTVKSREMGTQTDGAAEALVKSVEAGGGPSYVSLG